MTKLIRISSKLLLCFISLFVLSFNFSEKSFAGGSGEFFCRVFFNDNGTISDVYPDGDLCNSNASIDTRKCSFLYMQENADRVRNDDFEDNTSCDTLGLGYNCIISCIGDENLEILERGAECDPDSTVSICNPRSNLTCRQGEFGRNLCLTRQNILKNSDECFDSVECIDYSPEDELTYRCRQGPDGIKKCLSSTTSEPSCNCGAGDVCALVRGTTGIPFNSSSSVFNVETAINDNLNCISCFAEGESMGIIDSSINGGAPARRLALCTSAGIQNGAIQTVDLVNGNETDTIGCLRSEGGFGSTNFNQCKSCRESGGTWSGLGCIDSTPTGIVTWLIRIAYGVMGGVALIQFIIAGIYYQTGQEDKVREARKNIIATITGLAVLTFSILILRIIGINVLDILPIGSV